MIAGLVLYVLFHLTCGILAYGVHFTHFQRAYPSLAEEDLLDDILGSLLAAVMGPLGLGALLSLGFHDHGLLYRPSKR